MQDFITKNSHALRTQSQLHYAILTTPTMYHNTQISHVLPTFLLSAVGTVTPDLTRITWTPNSNDSATCSLLATCTSTTQPSMLPSHVTTNHINITKSQVGVLHAVCWLHALLISLQSRCSQACSPSHLSKDLINITKSQDYMYFKFHQIVTMLSPIHHIPILFINLNIT